MAKLYDGGEEIQETDRLLNFGRLEPWSPQDQGHMHYRVIEAVIVTLTSSFSQILSMIREDQRGGVSAHLRARQPPQQGRHTLIYKSHLLLIASTTIVPQVLKAGVAQIVAMGLNIMDPYQTRLGAGLFEERERTSGDLRGAAASTIQMQNLKAIIHQLKTQGDQLP